MHALECHIVLEGDVYSSRCNLYVNLLEFNERQLYDFNSLQSHRNSQDKSPDVLELCPPALRGQTDPLHTLVT